MINNIKDLRRVLALEIGKRRLFFIHPLVQYKKTLRICEYLSNKGGVINKFFLLFYKLRYRRLSVKLGFTIPLNCLGEGVSLPHYGGIIINGNVKIGKNCSIRPFTVIGNKRDGKNDEVPTIGDNVTIGANCSIIGKLHIGNNVVIGAGSVVTHSIPDNAIYCGNPAKEITRPTSSNQE